MQRLTGPGERDGRYLPPAREQDGVDPGDRVRRDRRGARRGAAKSRKAPPPAAPGRRLTQQPVRLRRVIQVVNAVYTTFMYLPAFSAD